MYDFQSMLKFLKCHLQMMKGKNNNSSILVQTTRYVRLRCHYREKSNWPLEISKVFYNQKNRLLIAFSSFMYSSTTYGIQKTNAYDEWFSALYMRLSRVSSHYKDDLFDHLGGIRRSDENFHQENLIYDSYWGKNMKNAQIMQTKYNQIIHWTFFCSYVAFNTQSGVEVVNWIIRFAYFF